MKPSQADGPTPDECVLLEVFRDIVVKEDARRPMDRKSLPPMAEMPALTRQLHEECVRECLKAGYMQTAAELFATGYVRGRGETLALIFLERLRVRFGELPDGTVERVNKLMRFPDDAVIERLDARLLTAATVDEVLADGSLPHS